MTDPAIIEAAFNSLWSNTRVNDVALSPDLLYTLAEKVTTYIAPLIRAATLEEAAMAIETNEEDYLVRMEAAGKIRALKEQP
jgi:hypothetical protein